jgi:hypothetical protein
MSPGKFYGEARLAGRWPEPLFVNAEPLEAVLPQYQKGTRSVAWGTEKPGRFVVIGGKPGGVASRAKGDRSSLNQSCLQMHIARSQLPSAFKRVGQWN